VILDVAEEYVYVGRIFPAPFGRVPNRAICAAQILERIQFVDITTVRFEKHQIQREFPLQGESAGKFVSASSTRIQVAINVSLMRLMIIGSENRPALKSVPLGQQL